MNRDTVETHARFRESLSLPYPLLADTDGRLCEAFGVLYERDIDGEKKLSISRSTFVADASGSIRKVWPKVALAGHAEDVLIALMELGQAH